MHFFYHCEVDVKKQKSVTFICFIFVSIYCRYHLYLCPMRNRSYLFLKANCRGYNALCYVHLHVRFSSTDKY